jgi:hypothetical protein
MTTFKVGEWTSREDVHRGGVGAYGCGVDPGLGLLDGVVVEEIAGFEVVGGVEDEMGWGKEFVDVGGDEVGDAGVDGDGGVEEGDLAAGGFGFGEGVAGVGFVEEDLALEVGGLDEVAVDEGEGADAGAGEEGGCSCSGGSDAYDGDVDGGEELLAGGSDAGEEDLAGVAFLILVWGLGLVLGLVLFSAIEVEDVAAGGGGDGDAGRGIVGGLEWVLGHDRDWLVE